MYTDRRTACNARDNNPWGRGLTAGIKQLQKSRSVRYKYVENNSKIKNSVSVYLSTDFSLSVSLREINFFLSQITDPSSLSGKYFQPSTCQNNPARLTRDMWQPSRELQGPKKGHNTTAAK